MRIKKWKRKAVSIILALTMVLGGIGIPSEAVYAEPQTFDFGGGVTGVIENGTLIVSNDSGGSGQMTDFDETNKSPIFNVPGIVDVVIEEGVASIGNRAFKKNPSSIITGTVTVSDSVYGIGENAFMDNQLASLIIGSNVKTIGASAFSMNQLTSVEIGGKVQTIGVGAFSSNNLTSVILPDSVTTIKSVAFENNDLIEITIGSGADIADDLNPMGMSLSGTTGQNIGFKAVYYAGGKQAGTYTWNASESKWEKVIQDFVSGDGTDENPYLIFTRADLEFLAEKTNAGDVKYNDKHYKLMNNIDLAGKQWTPIGNDVANAFKGTFQGNGKSISNLMIGSSTTPNVELDYAGLFGCINAAVITDLELTVSIYVNKQNMSLNIGGLVGYIDDEDKSVINNVTVRGMADVGNNVNVFTITGGLVGVVGYADIENSKSTVDINNGREITGGFAGELDKGLINNCQAAGDVRDVRNDFSNVGGFIGINSATIINCSATGNVTATGAYSKVGGFAGANGGSLKTIKNSYATGAVEGGDNSQIGGFVGENTKRIINSYTSGNVQGGTESTIGGFAGRNIGKWGGKGELIYTYNNGDITATAVGDNIEGKVESSAAIPAAEMKTVPGQAKALVDILNANRVSENAATEWKEWTVNSGITNGFPIFGKSAPIKYTVTFNSNGGSTVSTQRIDVGTKVIAPSNPTKSGYAFMGWYKDMGLANPWNFEVDVATENITLYAKWEKTSSGESPKDREDKPEPGPTSQPKQELPVIVIVNGKAENAGEETRKVENGKKVVEVAVKPEIIEKKITEALKNKEEGKKNIIEVPVADTTSEIVRAALTGDIVKKLEDNDFTVSVNRSNVRYNIPAKELTIEAIAKKLSINATQLREIKIEVQISKVSNEVVKQYEQIAKTRSNEIIVPPVEFNIAAKARKADGTTETVSISRFNSFVERVIEIPEGVDPNKITTGIVFNPDGSYSHVPTEVFKQNGKYYAKLNSLTNSTYSVIWNPLTVDAVKGHWSERAVNDMASRLVILEAGDFLPDKAVDRAEFANYMVRAFGLYREGFQLLGEQKRFLDIDENHPSLKGITIANEWGIIKGYTDGTFKPDNTITREEAMTMYARAMEIVKLAEVDKNRILSYKDENEVASWAYEAVKKTLGAGVFNGRAKDVIAPKGTLTHAEAATSIRNLLIEARLINK